MAPPYSYRALGEAEVGSLAQSGPQPATINDVLLIARSQIARLSGVSVEQVKFDVRIET